ncbi:TPA: dihydrodipicolinate synthase family protein, partial [Campylobacter coli]|nr:dihydrodipicolinate synthase family protein [Campylobacter coli]
SGNIDKCVDLLAHEPRMILISGEDAINYPILSNGGKGVISVTSNLLPDMISKLTHLALEENYKEAKKINDELYNINKILFCESNPIPIKTAMYIAGLIESLEFRLPLCSPSKENFAKIEEVMKKYKIKGF